MPASSDISPAEDEWRRKQHRCCFLARSEEQSLNCPTSSRDHIEQYRRFRLMGAQCRPPIPPSLSLTRVPLNPDYSTSGRGSVLDVPPAPVENDSGLPSFSHSSIPRTTSFIPFHKKSLVLRWFLRRRGDIRWPKPTSPRKPQYESRVSLRFPLRCYCLSDG